MTDENVILVDENDNEIGTMEKIKAHEEGGKLHRAFSIFVFNTDGEMMLQKRADSKYHAPGKWTNTCCSHPRKGETLEEATRRRLDEEMGFTCDMEKVFDFIYRADVGKGLTEWEYDHVFIGIYDDEPELNPDEASDWKWIDPDVLLEDVEKNPDDYTPWFKEVVDEVVEKFEENKDKFLGTEEELDFKGTLAHYKSKVEEEMRKYFDEKSDSFEYKDEFVEESIELLKDFTLRGGKRIRATLITMAYRGYSGDKSDKRIIRPSAAMEFMQGALLTHDDIIDDADMRRGKRTPHIWIKDWYQENVADDEREAKKYGTDMAIILGDLYNSFGIDCILGSGFSEKKKLDALKIYNSTFEKTGKGQILDIWFSEGRSDDLDEEDHYNVIDRKTVEYSVTRPMMIGAKLAGAPDEQLEVIRNFSFPLGRAYQLQDDLLDFFADEEKLGKPILADLKEGKHTIMVIKALENGNEEQVERLRELLGSDELSEKDIEDARRIMKETGSYQYSKELIQDYIDEAKKWIPKLDCDEELKEFCRKFAEYMEEREY